MKQMLPKAGKNGAMLTLDNVSSVVIPHLITLWYLIGIYRICQIFGRS
jgi:hypothetical protein